MTLELVVVDFDDVSVGPPEYEAYLRRAERNQRYHCEYCGAFISKEWGDKCWRWTDYGNEWNPHCPPGKGCGK